MMGQKIVIQFLASGLSGVLAFLTLSLSTRLFGAQILGEVAYLGALLGLVFGFSDLGLSRAHIHFTAAVKGRPPAGFLLLKLGLLGICALVSVITAAINHQLTWLFLTLLLFELLFRLADGLLITFEGREKVWPQNLIRLSGKLVKLITVVVFSLWWQTSLGYALTFLAEGWLVLVLAQAVGSRLWRLRPDPGAVRDYLSYSLPFALIMPLSYWQDNGLILVLRHFWSASTVGIFAATFGLFGLIKSLSASLMVFFFPRISRLNSLGDTAAIQRYTDMAVKFSLWLLLPLALVIMVAAGPLIRLVLGQSFAAGAGILRWLAAGVVILSVFTPYDHVLFATKNHRPIVWVNLVTTAGVLVLGWLLVPLFSGVGAAIALVAGWSVSGVWQFLILRQKTGIRFLSGWRLTRSEVKYLYGIFNPFGQTIVRSSRKKAGASGA